MRCETAGNERPPPPPALRCHFVLGEYNGTPTAVVRLYTEKYPNHRVPNRRNFLYVDQRIRGRGTVRRIKLYVGRPRSVHAPIMEESTLDVVREDCSVSTGRVSTRQRVSHWVVYRT
jgi:hypothetical protein